MLVAQNLRAAIVESDIGWIYSGVNFPYRI